MVFLPLIPMAGSKIRVGIITDHGNVPRWGVEALRHVGDLIEITEVYSCRNTTARRDYISHFAYYCLNVLAIRNAWTRGIAYSPCDTRAIEFDADNEGG